MKDSLGTRIKENYENRTRSFLNRRTYTIFRIDGKAFHTYTKGLIKPFDDGLIYDMDQTAAYLCEKIEGAKLAYVQSDEISVIVTDFDNLETQAWYDNNLQKMASVSASLATARFNQLRYIRAAEDNEGLIGDHPDRLSSASGYLHVTQLEDMPLAMFDSRVFQISEKSEVLNYLLWRQQDATRNSISSVAQSLYPHSELEGASSNLKQELIFQKGINWNDYPSRKKRGGVIVRVVNPDTNRSSWRAVPEIPVFSQDWNFLNNVIPSLQ